MRKNIFNPFYLLLVTAFLLFGSVAYADEVTNYFYNTTTCPESVDSYSCGSDYIILKSPKTCKTAAEMTSAYNACYAVSINGIHQDMRCDYTNACYWHSDPNTTKCSTLYRSFTQLNNPTAACGACVSGYTDCSGTCKINKTCPSGYTPNTCADTCTLAAQKVKELPAGSGTWVTEITEDTVGGGASQWTTSGTNIYNTNTGNVGIGTTTPSQKLEVAGGAGTTTFRLNRSSGTGPGYWDQLISHTSASNYGSLYFTPSVATGDFAVSDNASAIRFYIDTSAGNVGIGTTPVNKLDIEGGTAIGATYSGLRAAPTNGLIVEGNVGVGTYTPVNKLDIEGGVAIGSSYAGTSAAPANGLIVQGNAAFGTTIPVQNFDVAGGFFAGSVVQCAYGIEISGTSVAANFHNRGSCASAVTDKDITISPYNTGTGLGDIILNVASGKVGIGTTTPGAKLDVETGNTSAAATIGDITNSATGIYAVAMGYDSDAAGTASMAMGYDANTDGDYSVALGKWVTAGSGTASGAIAIGTGVAAATRTMATGFNSMAFGTNSMAIGAYGIAIGQGARADGSSSVAIGNMSDAGGDHAFAIGYDSTVDGTNSISIGALNTIYSGSDQSIALGSDISILGSHVLAISLADHPTSWYTSTSNVMTIMGGKVGIETLSPATKLQVNGGTDCASTSTSGGYVMVNSGTSTNVCIDNNEIMARSNGATSPLYIQNDGGNVQFGGQVIVPNMNTYFAVFDGWPREVRIATDGKLVHYAPLVSSKRYKDEIEELNVDSIGLYNLNPVSFVYSQDVIKEKNLPSGAQIGLIAEELEEFMPEFVIYDEAGRPDAIDYEALNDKLTLYLLKAIQDQQVAIKDLEARIKALELK